MSTRKRKIKWYYIIANRDLVDLCQKIYALNKKDRKKEYFQVNRFIFLENFGLQSKRPRPIYGGYLSSAKIGHAPPLIHSQTLQERENPKELDEGEKEKTHFVFCQENPTHEEYRYLVLFESRAAPGVSFGQFVNYLSDIASKKLNLNLRLQNGTIIREDFLDTLSRLTRIPLAVVYADKTLGFSSPLKPALEDTTVRDTVEIYLKSKPRRTISHEVLKFLKQKVGNEIKRLRIWGYTSSKDPVLLDTDKMGKDEYVEVELLEDGTVNSLDILKKMTGFWQIYRSYGVLGYFYSICRICEYY